MALSLSLSQSVGRRGGAHLISSVLGRFSFQRVLEANEEYIELQLPLPLLLLLAAIHE